MRFTKIQEKEYELANKFISFAVKDSFSILGWHKNYDSLIFRAYLDRYWDWSIIAEGKKIKADLILDHNGFYSWQIDQSIKRPKKYILKGTQANSNRSIIDPYSYHPVMSPQTKHLWNSGQLWHAWKDFGAKSTSIDNQPGFIFRVWAPHANRVAVVGDFNNWNPLSHGMLFDEQSGVWQIFIPNIDDQEYCCYKYHIINSHNQVSLKADPYALQMEHPPKNASVIYDLPLIKWTDQKWIKNRQKKQAVDQPISIYEVHLGSWRKKNGRYLSYLEMEAELVSYVKDMGFTHVEFMPVSEYPLDASWGYQPLGLFAPTIRFGTGQELKQLINTFHKHDIGVIGDWVPAHFPADKHGLVQFDGSYLYEYQDLRKGFHPDWKTLIFNYSRLEVINYLVSNINYWLQEYHFDGLRFDAVSSMLYLSYSRQEGQWEKNEQGGPENLEAIELIKAINKNVHEQYPGILTFAEESTMWQGVSANIENNGLGFDYKWNMGWMNDSLSYIKLEFDQRADKHHVLTHCIDYAFTENYLLPISHDEVVHGKSAMIGKFPGFDEHKFAQLKTYYSFMWSFPGKKLLFMGNEFGQRKEWDFNSELTWELLQYAPHQGLQTIVRRLNHLYRQHPALHSADCQQQGFCWLKKNDMQENVFAYYRYAPHQPLVIVIINFSQNQYKQKLGVPVNGTYQMILNTDSQEFAGSNPNCHSRYESTNTSWDNQYHSIEFDLAALSAIFFIGPKKD